MDSFFYPWLHEVGPADRVIAGSDRLARALRQAHSEAQLAAGKQAWERPEILPLAAFLRQLHQDWREQDERALPLLSPLAERLVWEAVVEASSWSGRLLQPAAYAAALQKTWQRQQADPIPHEALRDAESEDTRAFLALSEEFEQRLAALGRLSFSQLPGALREFLPRWTRQQQGVLHLVGMEEVSRAEHDFLDGLAAGGLAVHWQALPTTPGDCRRCSLADPATEARAAATWVARQLADNPAARIGLVAMDINERKSELATALQDTLAPAHAASFSNDPLPFNVSLGEPLAEQGMVADALQVLGLGGRALPLARIGRLLRSVYLFPRVELGLRSRLEARLRNNGYAELGLRFLRRNAAQEGLESLASVLEAYQEAIDSHLDERLPSAWARVFSEQLAMVGWGRRADGQSLSSAEYQCREAFNGLLASLGEADSLGRPWGRSMALAQLGQLAAERLFQPQGAAAQVQLLGGLEATGLQFDAVWVLGLDDTALPLAARPDPVIPVALQQAHGWPHASAEQERAFAERWLARLKATAAHCVFSHSEQDKDRLLRPSPLIDDLPAMAAPAVDPGVASQRQQLAVELDAVSDLVGPAVTDDVVRGGVSLIEDQSACAFRAFARHRLAATDWPTPLAGPDALLRGQLVHDVLEQLWRQWKTQAALQALAGDRRRQVIEAVVTEQVDASVAQQPVMWPKGLAELEIRRLVQLVEDWVAVELSRDDFEVIATELQAEVQAGPLRLRGRIDRVDRLADGELIIDYKTGGQLSRSGWHGERPASPQLPLYAINRPAAPQGIAYGKVRAGETELIGMAADASDYGLKAVEKESGASWEEQLADWQASLARLGEAFHAGQAAPDPLPGACRYCHLAGLCRIDEIQGEEAALGSGDNWHAAGDGDAE